MTTDAQITTVRNREKPSTPMAPPMAVNGPRSASWTRSHSGHVVDGGGDGGDRGHERVEAVEHLLARQCRDEHEPHRGQHEDQQRSDGDPFHVGVDDGLEHLVGALHRRGQDGEQAHQPVPSSVGVVPPGSAASAGVPVKPDVAASGSWKSVASSIRVDERGDRGLDPLEHGLGIHAEEHDEADQRQHHGELAEAHVLHGQVVLAGLAVEHPLVGPQQVEGGEDHAAGGDDRPPLGGEVRARQHEELADEAVEAGQPDRAEASRA